MNESEREKEGWLRRQRTEKKTRMFPIVSRAKGDDR